ncbi:hypothetical protein Patl1_07754 [Pistacia atlantica]|uniref:Uncharacterized protein n=1 Tax=Pistacia atlantica TaxID=434234 RepID=A0ACC1AG68_9ROSI|nr:hypothetical protein Patl1_07754 [Pistacia atlantica]
MCFPGSEIPDWFNIQSCGSSIELPQGDGYNGVSKKLFSVNEPKNIESDHIFLGYNCNTFDFREFSYNTEAIINFSCNKSCLCKITKYTKDNINSQAKIYLKKCGIRYCTLRSLRNL